ncbi:MAG: phosphatidate cytidylyltransferase [Candidatus Fournierella pullistercoris]|uniref:Phosphatidate cytidylyltransferase n=1 Tax=Candidatus Allofournierella pullistercoris TaxID=2838597 RepID=A0A948WRB3_9FIRM|nr:phosphatidate cytidylyltransferase [Candidatus Fournierella pullistercoris]
MKTRIITAAVGLCILALVMVFFDTLLFEAVVALIALIAVHEIYDAFSLGEKTKHIFYGFIPYTLLLMSFGTPASIFLIPGTFLFAVYLVACVLWQNQSLSVSKLGGMVLFSAYMLTCFFSIVFIKHQMGNVYEAMYLILLILCFAWGGDSAAYFAGRFFGKRKLAPVVSPHKTVEGAIGGVLGSGVLGVICTQCAVLITQSMGALEQCRLLSYMTQFPVQSYLIIFVVGMCCSVLGILGDLFASAVKRQCQLKDYGTIFPGHGGIMDRFDSVTLIAPLAAILVWFVTEFLVKVS